MYLNTPRKLSVPRKASTRNRSQCFSPSPETQGTAFQAVKAFPRQQRRLVAEYRTLDAIYEAIEDCQGVAKKEKELNTFWKESLGIGRSPLKALKDQQRDGILKRAAGNYEA